MPEHISSGSQDGDADSEAGPPPGGFPDAGGVPVDLTALLLRPQIASRSAAVTDSVDADETTRWYEAYASGIFAPTADPPDGTDLALLIRAPVAKVPAWQVLLRDQFQIDGLAALPALSSGAILFARTNVGGKEQYVAWCFGQGSRWLRRQAQTPRFGLLAALNALAAAESDGSGVTGASLTARDGNLRRANLSTAVPTTADAIPRIDTLADVLVSARIRTGHEVLGVASAGKSLQFSAVIKDASDFRRLSDLIVDLAGQDGYRRSHGWIDFIVPEADDSVCEAVLDAVWAGFDAADMAINVDIAWWADPREPESDHPVTHWRLAGERAGKFAVRNRALTWPGVRSQLTRRLGTTAGAAALETNIRFFASDDEELGHCNVRDLLSAELTIDGVTYVLADGEICRIEADFLTELDHGLQQLVAPSNLVPYQAGEAEADYNSRAAQATGMLKLDTTDIRPSGATQIEPCDLLGADGTLCHLKRHTSATGISHLANQAISSATVLLRRPESRAKMRRLIDQSTWDGDKDRIKSQIDQMPTSVVRLPVVLAIIGEWSSPAIKNLSLLSRLALRSASQKLRDLGFPVQIMLIGPTPPQERPASAMADSHTCPKRRR